MTIKIYVLSFDSSELSSANLYVHHNFCSMTAAIEQGIMLKEEAGSSASMLL